MINSENRGLKKVSEIAHINIINCQAWWKIAESDKKNVVFSVAMANLYRWISATGVMNAKHAHR